MIYDVCIIGSGMAGLYTAYKFKKFYPDMSFLILEKTNTIGGRAGNASFSNTQVVTGAGVGRKSKDKLLSSLLNDLHFEIKEFEFQPQYSKKLNTIDILQIMKILRERYNNEHMSFSRFAKKILGSKLYTEFVVFSGYRDYLNEGTEDTLTNYGMDDNICCWKAFSVPWEKLIQKLIDFIGKNRFRKNKEVKYIRDLGDRYKLNTDKRTYYCRKIILATTVESVYKLLKLKIYKSIKSQSFLRLYGKFSIQSVNILKNYLSRYTVVPGVLQKIIPMNVDNGVYMIVYNDNKNADALKKKLKNNKKNRYFYEREVENALDIPRFSLKLEKIKGFYWKAGTHYYLPLHFHSKRVV